MAGPKKEKDLMEKLADAVRVGLEHLPDSKLWDEDWAWEEYTSDEQEAVKKARRRMNLALELYEVYQELNKAIEEESRCIHYLPMNGVDIVCGQLLEKGLGYQSYPEYTSDKEKVTCEKCRATRVFRD